MAKKNLTPKAGGKSGKARVRSARKAEEEKDKKLEDDEEDKKNPAGGDGDGDGYDDGDDEKDTSATEDDEDPDKAEDDDEDPDEASEDDEDPDKAEDDDEDGKKKASSKSSAKARIKAILGSAEAESRPKLAQHLALNTNVSVKAAVSTLKVAAKETNGKVNHLAAAMNGMDNPKLKQNGVNPGGETSLVNDMKSRFAKK